MIKLHVRYFVFVLALSKFALAGDFDSGSDGSDGFFVPGDPETVIDLGLAETGPWEMPGNGNGVYDPDLWVVVFKYTIINIPSGVTVSFINHPSGAPVVWLAQMDVTIGGIVSLNGESYNAGPYPEPGPGGFAGATAAAGGLPASSGFGPGGANADQGGQYNYGSPSIIPLIGGSGGGPDDDGSPGGGAGGGAILIASSATISLLEGSQVSARGGTGNPIGGNSTGGGSGGAIRLIANTITGGGSLQANSLGGSPVGGLGRIRIEAFDLDGYTGPNFPAYTASAPGTVFPPSNAPVLRATMVDGQPVPADPEAGVLTTDVLAKNQTVIITIEARNIPTKGTTVVVQVRPAHGSAIFVTAPPLSGSFALSTTQVIVPLSVPADEVPVEIQLIANWTN